MLRRPTQMRRRTIATDAAVIVAAEDAFRRVTLVVPEGAGLYAAIGPYEQLPGDTDKDAVGAKPESIGRTRLYFWAPLDGGQSYDFDLAPGQYLSAGVDEKAITTAVIITYPE